MPDERGSAAEVRLPAAFDVAFTRVVFNTNPGRAAPEEPSGSDERSNWMTIRERTSGGAIILDVDGRMTIETVNDRPLTVRVRRLLQEGQRRILVNLKGVPYLDTSGLCDIVEGYVTVRRQGGALKLLHPTAHVRTVLTTTRLLTILEAYDSESAAIASFGQLESQPSNTWSPAGPPVVE